MEHRAQANGASQRFDGIHEVSILFSFSYTCLELITCKSLQHDSMIEDQSFPESEENTFQIIHSKKRVTCIYQIEQDHTLVAVSQLSCETCFNLNVHAYPDLMIPSLLLGLRRTRSPISACHLKAFVIYETHQTASRFYS